LIFNPHRLAAETPGRFESRLPVLTATLLGVPISLGEQRTGTKKLKYFLPYFSLFGPKQSTKRKAARSLACGSPHENHKHGVITNSYPPAGLRQVTPCFRVYELRSATLQRV